MIQLKIVNISPEEDPHFPEEQDEFLRGTKLIINILHTWVNKQRRVFNVDKYFASMQVRDELKNHG